MTSGGRENLVYMANQIASFFATQHHEAAALGVADHIAAFWAPAMRQSAFAEFDAEPARFTPLARAGLAVLRGRDAATLGPELEHQGGVSFTQERGSDAG